MAVSVGTRYKQYNASTIDSIAHNGVIFYNQGSVNAKINGWPLPAGSTYGWTHNQGEINHEPIEIAFDISGGLIVATYLVYTHE